MAVLFFLTFSVTTFAATKTNYKAPTINSLLYYQSGSSYNAKLSWKAKKNYSYLIIRKSPGKKYKAIGRVKASSNTGVYYDKNIGPHAQYTYSVRRVISKQKYSKYDSAGISLCANPKVTVTCGNLYSNIKWTKVKGASNYRVYRKNSKTGKYSLIAKCDSSSTSYKDYYYKNVSKDKLNDNVFLDPSNNDFVYTVRAQVKKRINSRSPYKYSYSLYLRDGDFHLESPSIVTVTENEETATIKWGTVPNADGYEVLSKDTDNNWEVVKKVKSSSLYNPSENVTEQCDVPKSDWYSVRAYSEKNGENSYSGYDTDFTTANRKYDDNILWIGDSITYGSPYYRYKDSSGISPEWHMFTIPNRVNQLTGNIKTAALVNETEGTKTHYYNPSIPGSTYYTPIYKYVNSVPMTKPQLNNGTLRELPFNDGDKTKFNRRRITTQVVAPIAEGKTPAINNTLGTLENSTSIEDYDVVVLSAGTNDYLDCAPLGSKSDWSRSIDNFDSNGCKEISFFITDENNPEFNPSFNVNTFYGAYNTIMKHIENASRNRVAAGKKPIKVVSVDLFYSDRTYSYKKLTNRFITPNDVSKVNGLGEGGHTLTDYQNCINTLNSIWNDSPYIKVYTFHTNSLNIVTSKNCPFTSSDNLHFTKYVYCQFGNKIADFLINNVFSDLFVVDIPEDETSEEVTSEIEETENNIPESEDKSNNIDVTDEVIESDEEFETDITEDLTDNTSHE